MKSYSAVLVLLLTSCVSTKGSEFKELPAPKEMALWEKGVILLGDTGTGEADQYRVAHGIEEFCKTERCDEGLLLGDNFYPLGVRSATDAQFDSKFEKPYKNLGFKFHPVIGNHDAYGNWKAEVEYKSPKWDIPAQWYDFQDGDNAHFYGLDTNWSPFQRKDKGKPQREWLDGKLSQSTALWNVVYGHAPVYSSGEHGDTERLKDFLKPMLLKHHVDFYISGHDHNQELIEKDGVTYIVSGSGSKTRKVGSGKHTIYSAATLGFAHLLLLTDGATVSFMDADGKVVFQRHYNKEAKGAVVTPSPEEGGCEEE